MRDELHITPSKEGQHTYEILSIADSNYKDIPVVHKPVHQTVHPLADAVMRQGGQHLGNCEGKFINIDFELMVCTSSSISVSSLKRSQGSSPWTITYRTTTAKGTTSEPVVLKDITSSVYTSAVEIPPEIDRDGGEFKITLLSIEDSRGCQRALSVSDISVDVRRSKPTARFAHANESASVVIKEGEKHHIPLRLTGVGPWKITYKYESSSSNTVEMTAHSANSHLSLTQPGKVTLLSVEDRFCTGDVVIPDSSFELQWFPRPSLAIDSTTLSSPNADGVFALDDVCRDSTGEFSLSLTGAFFQYMYFGAYREFCRHSTVHHRIHSRNFQREDKKGFARSISIRICPTGAPIRVAHLSSDKFWG